MATIFYWTTKGTPNSRPIYGVHPSSQPVKGDVPNGISSLEVAEEPHTILWPIPEGRVRGREQWCVIDTTTSPEIKLNPALVPVDPHAILKQKIETVLADALVASSIKDVFREWKTKL